VVERGGEPYRIHQFLRCGWCRRCDPADTDWIDDVQPGHGDVGSSTEAADAEREVHKHWVTGRDEEVRARSAYPR
jgi:hypothetical protein